tara:strand:- start:5592 stop:8459 length:2868 start_codon:yes stop_codon:yes gene_type:complete
MAKRKRLQGQGTNQPVGFADIGGIGRAGRMASASMQPGIDAADAIFNFASKKLDIKRAKEGASEAATVQFKKVTDERQSTDPAFDPEDANNPNSPNFAGNEITVNLGNGFIQLPELKSELTITGRAYNKQLLSRYEAQLNNDISNTITEIAIKNPSNPNKFQKEAGSYITETVKQVDPRIRPQVEQYTNQLYSRLTSAVLQEKAKLDLANTKLQESFDHDRHENDLFASGVIGDPKVYQEVRKQFAERLRNSETYSTMGPAFIEQRLRKADIRSAQTHMVDMLARMNKHLDRSKAVEGLLQGEGDLTKSSFIKSLNLKKPEIDALVAGLRTVVVGMRGVDNAQNRQNVLTMIGNVLPGIAKSTGLDLDVLGVTPEVIAQNPTAALSLLNKLSDVNNRNSQSKRVQMQIRDLTNASDPYLSGVALQTLQDARKNGLNEGDTLILLRSRLEDAEASVKAETKEIVEAIPVINAMKDYSRTGKGRSVERNEKTIRAVDRIFNNLLEDKGMSTDPNIYDDDRVVDMLTEYVSMHGIIPTSFINYARTAIGTQDVKRTLTSANIIKMLDERAPLANIMDSLGSQFGKKGTNLVDRYRFIINTGLHKGGNDQIDLFKDVKRLSNSERLEIFRRMSGKDSDVKDSQLKIDLTNQIQELTQNEVGPNFIKRNMPGVLRDAFNLTRDEKFSFQELRARTKPLQISKEFIEEVQFVVNQRIDRFATYEDVDEIDEEDLIKKSIMEVLLNGNYGPSYITAPANSNFQGTRSLSLVKNAPEVTMTDMNGNANFARKALTKEVKKIGKRLGYTGKEVFQADEPDDPDSPNFVNAILPVVDGAETLQLGKNTFLDFLRSDIDGTPIYNVIVNYLDGPQFLTDGDGRAIRIRSRKLINNQNKKLITEGLVESIKRHDDVHNLAKVHDLNIDPSTKLLELPTALGRYIQGDKFGMNPAVVDFVDSIIDDIN